MCGIAATTKKSASMEAALDALRLRGPDGQDSDSYPAGVLAQTRLAIIDLSETGRQPMRDNERDLAIVFNGEIYNYRELRTTLMQRGHRFRTESDTEVILKAYVEWGEECPKHLDGMFAFVLADNEKQQLFFARDRFGKKPLYYHIDAAGELYAASEIKALIAMGVKPEIDRGAIDNYLQLMYIPPWKSVYGNIHLLPPAHAAIFKDKRLSLKRFWRLESAPLTISYDDAKVETKRLIRDAVKKRMLASDVEVGALLSGGVDSTLVSIFAAEFLDHPLKTFSLGYGDYINELPFAKEASERIGSEQYTEQAGGDLVHELEAIISYFDEPHADSSDFPQHLLSRLAASKVKVALSGDGGDELFLGYGWNTRHRHLSRRHDTFEKYFLNPLQGRVRATRIFPPLERAILWGSPFAPKSDVYMEGAYEGMPDAIAAITVFDLTTYLPGQLLTKVDRASMMHSLEMRAPLLDTALTEFVFNLPREYKIGPDGTQKRILKDILVEYMPHDFVYRRKQGFGAPIAKWLREDTMSTYARIKLGAQDARIRTLLSGRVIDWYVRDFYERGKNRGALRLWTLLCLAIWLEQAKPEL